MDELDQYTISKILGSKMTPVKRGHFGNFGLLETTVEAIRAKQAETPNPAVAPFSYATDRRIVQAFEDIRNGYATDAILWNKSLAEAFGNRCHELGIEAPGRELNRRLIHIRKSVRTYEKHGITLKPAIRREPRVSLVPQYAYAIEFALVRLRYRHGASIDDILLDPALGDKFEELALQLAPGVGSEELRLGALYIRKTRHFEKKELRKIQSLDVATVERRWSEAVLLATVRAQDIPSSPGLIELKDGDNYLYIARNENIKPAVEQLQTGRAFELVSTGFWEPRSKDITIQFILGEKLEKIGMAVWERRLIFDRTPIFNWPIQNGAA